MKFEDFFLMRNEILLTIIALILLVAEIFVKSENHKKVIPLALGLFLINTIIGFFPINEAILFGGMFKTDALRMVMKNILNIGVFVVMIQAVEWLKKDENSNRILEFYILLIFTLVGMNFMVSSGDFLMFYLGLETATIPIAALAAYDRYKNKSAEAGVKLILSSALSSGILLYGLSMIYGTVGSVYFDKVAEGMSMTNSLQVMAFMFFFAGMAFKISIVPFHLWTADVYEGAPISVASYLSVVSKGAAVFIFGITLVTVFKAISPVWENVLWVTAAITMTLGNLFALRQKNLRRFLAFSSIAQAGFIFLGLISNSELGITTAIYFVLIYIFSNLGAFGVVSIIENKTGKDMIDDYDGLYRTNPKLSLTMMLALFSLAGIPPVAGFFGKFFLFTAAAKSGFYILVLIAVLNTIVSLYYYLLIVKAMFLNQSEKPIEYFKTDWYSRIGLLICVVGLVVTGFASNLFEYLLQLSGLLF